MQPVCDLDAPSSWSLKGEGNANAVFGYLGTKTALVFTD